MSILATPGENDVTSSSFLGVPVVELHLWGSISLKLQSQEEESSSGSYYVVWPWPRCKTLVTYLVAHLSCEMINNRSLPEIMVLWPQAGSKGNVMMLAYSLFLEGTVSGESRQDFREDLTRIWERLESPVSGLPKSGHLGIFCLRRDPHNS